MVKKSNEENLCNEEEVIAEKKLSEEEILSILSNKLVKPITVNKLCEDLNINMIELFGYTNKLKNNGINIMWSDKDNELKLVINNQPDLSKENVLKISEDINSVTKIGVISDLRAGSKSEQIALWNDCYKRFAKEGITKVFITGNLLEGKYGGDTEKNYGSSLISNNAYGQADHLIDYFPKVEGITTYFITGDTDHSFGKELNVGSYISSQRKDMVYLGPKNCTVQFNNVTLRLENLKKQGEDYTMSYKPQKYSRGLSCYEDYDIILMGGTLTAQNFPQLRDSNVYTIPSLVDRTARMKSNYQQNTMGCWEFDITYNKMGKLKRLDSTLVPYYLPSPESYLTTSPLALSGEEIESIKNVNNNSTNKSNELFRKLDYFYKKINKKEESFVSVRDRLNLTDDMLFGIIDMLQKYGREIEVVEINGELVIHKFFQKRRHSDVKLPKEELQKFELGIVSDSHYISRYSQPSMVNTFAYECYNRGINTMVHVGDVCDGDYHTIRPDYLEHVFVYGPTGTVNYVAKTLPKYPGMEWKFICGSHDQSLSFNYPVFDFGTELEKLRPDTEYLGQDRGYLKLGNCNMEIFHPGGGSSRIISTRPQNGIDQLAPRTKPNIKLEGHFHKVYYGLIRNIHTILCPCNVDQSSFMMKKEIPNLMGDCFLTIWVDKYGDVQYFEPEFMIFDQKDVRKNDYENPVKYMKNKILTLK